MACHDTAPKRKLILLKLLIIFNPSAAHGRSVKKLAVIRRSFENLGMDATFLPTSHPGHGAELVADTDLSGYDGVVAAGGDGTLFEVLNGLYRHPRAERVPLGLLPIGTGNAFARELQLRGDTLAHAIEILHRGRTRQVDVGHVKAAEQSFYFINIVVMGFAVDAGLTARKLKFLGEPAYTLATLWQVLKLKSYPLIMETDGVARKSDNIFIAVSNSRYTGTHFLIAPSASLDDGQLDLTVLEKLPRSRLLKLFPSIYSGRHVEYDEVMSLRAAHVVFRSPAGLMLGPDGEFCGKSPAEISCLHRDLEIFC
jgi:diacylglycerol kinase (ATP)